MSIIGDLYEEDIYKYSKVLRKKMEDYIEFLGSLKAFNLTLGDMRNAVLVKSIEEFKRVFKSELKL